MACSRDARFSLGGGVGVHAHLLSEGNACCVVVWPRYLAFKVEKKG